MEQRQKNRKVLQLNKVVRSSSVSKDLKVRCELCLGEEISRWREQCKGPGVGLCLVCLRNKHLG